MALELRERPVEQTAAAEIIDCDIHPKVRSLEDLRPWLSNRWWDHLQTYGLRSRHGFAKGSPYPKAAPMACRRDAWPAAGGAVRRPRTSGTGRRLPSRAGGWRRSETGSGSGPYGGGSVTER